jgi:DNA-binding response OmpR family regulator
MSVLSPVVLIATRNEPLARLCHSALEQGNFLCAVEVAADWRAAAVQATWRPPNLILLEGDLFMEHPQEAQERLLSASPKPALIVVDLVEDVNTAIAAFAAGAIGYITVQPRQPTTLTRLTHTAEWALRRAGHLPPRGRILVVDDSTEILRTLGDILKIEGFEVFTARSAALAETLYRQELVHLAVVDVRLVESEHDANDTSGLDLARRIDPVVPCILMTSHPSIEGVRQAMGEIGAVDYLVKPKGELNELLQAITRAFDERVHINWRLQIHWDEDVSLESLVNMLEDYRDAPEDAQARAALELEELLRKLFMLPVDHIEVRYMSPGRGGSGVVLVVPYRDGLQAQAVVVKFGRRDSMRREQSHYEQFVLPFAGRCSTQLRGAMAETLSFAGLKFSFVGLSKDTPRNFNTFYRDPSVSTGRVCQAVQTLFEDNCRLWYQGKRRWDSGTGDALARAFEAQLNLDRPSKQQELRTCITDLLNGRWVEDTRLLPHSSTRFALEVGEGSSSPRRLTLLDPLTFVQQRQHLPAPTYRSITHGDLNGGNIFVDEGGRPWLIDFFKSGWGPVLRDLAELESVVKFELIETRNLRALLDFEQAILRPTRFDQPLYSTRELEGQGSAELRRALAVISTLRRLAQRLGDAWSTAEYDVGLLYYALKVLTQRGNTAQGQARYPVRARHALFSAAMLCTKLAWGRDGSQESQNE